MGRFKTRKQYSKNNQNQERIFQQQLKPEKNISATIKVWKQILQIHRKKIFVATIKTRK